MAVLREESTTPGSRCVLLHTAVARSAPFALALTGKRLEHFLCVLAAERLRASKQLSGFWARLPGQRAATTAGSVLVPCHLPTIPRSAAAGHFHPAQ